MKGGTAAIRRPAIAWLLQRERISSSWSIPIIKYTPMLIPAMAAMISNGLYHCVPGSRILGGQALQGSMPAGKYVANRFLTFAENLLMGAKLSEYHTGSRFLPATSEATATGRQFR